MALDQGASASVWASTSMPSSQQRHQRRQYGDDELILNYRDAVVYGRDLKLLEESSSWLNDSLLHFGMLRLHHRYCRPGDSDTEDCDKNNDSDQDGSAKRSRQDHDRNEHNGSLLAPSAPSSILYVDPSVLSFLMHQVWGGDEDEEELLSEFCTSHNYFRGVQVAFLPVNDDLADSRWNTGCAHMGMAAGTHWSLLVVVSLASSSRENDDNKVDIKSLRFHHFDSVKGYNYAAAVAVATLWARLWTMREKKNNHNYGKCADECEVAETEVSPSVPTAAGVAADGDRPASQHPTTTTVVRVCEYAAVPQQSNGYDCGLHVLGTIEAILLDRRRKEQTMTMTTTTTPPGGMTASLQDYDGTMTREVAAVVKYFGGDSARVCLSLRQRMVQEIRDLASASA